MFTALAVMVFITGISILQSCSNSETNGSLTTLPNNSKNYIKKIV